MSGLFGGGSKKTPTPVAADPPPTIEDAEVRAQETEDVLRRRKGAAALVLTGKSGAGTPTTAAKTLLGG